MRNAPFWPGMEALGPALAYDHAAILGKDASIPRELAARVAVLTLVMHGDASYPFTGETARALTQAIPHAELCTLAGITVTVSRWVGVLVWLRDCLMDTGPARILH